MNTLFSKFRAADRPEVHSDPSGSSWFLGQTGAYLGFFLAVAVCMAAAFALSQHEVPLILGSLTNV